ncbi:MAG: RtcB family protein [Chitinophagaceae bacterium]|nr:RtcB family protein [Anaerolineae bacterium]
MIKQAGLRGKQSGDAWRIFKQQGYTEAVAFVTALHDAKPSTPEKVELRTEPAPYKVWGQEHIEEGAFSQMVNAMRLPISVVGALMPDAHQGYGLPIGGVLATENAVIPYAVGVDIACRVMLTVYEADTQVLDKAKPEYKLLHDALLDNTIFGSGGEGLHNGKYEHPVLDERHWQATDLLRGLRKTAVYQIGTSGTGNHFVEWGQVTITQADNDLGLKPGQYLALLSHSGSRGVGYKIANYYSQLAMSRMSGLPESVKHLAWLGMDTSEGQEYWDAMTLAGEFASANHHIIHEQVAKAAGLTPVAVIENHHNFAWKETVTVDGTARDVIVHRKGATPAGAEVMGMIPGTMADPGYLIQGKGEPTSLNSASHGGGRQMSRTQAKKTITSDEHKRYLKAHGVTLIGGGLDEAPQAYKDIHAVMDAQADLVQIVGQFQPRLVRMAVDTPSWKRKSVPTDIVDAEGD